MKMTRREFLNISTAAAVVCAATLLPVEKAAAAQQTMAAQELLEQAYLYAFPLVLMDATRKVSTNTETPNDTRAPINQFIHAKKLADAASRAVVTPNVDAGISRCQRRTDALRCTADGPIFQCTGAGCVDKYRCSAGSTGPLRDHPLGLAGQTAGRGAADQCADQYGLDHCPHRALRAGRSAQRPVHSG